ncbi:MAG: hypothetical protein LBN02_06540 [Oscillospiraceae bacterium]|jgi:hypothetical protein|nr:hypothetical protein [Oscillospiraceae bacterium]
MEDQKKPYKRRWGDRSDGRRIRTLDPYHGLMPYIMVKRNDASNQLVDPIEVTEIDKFLRKLRVEQNMPGVGMLHLIVAMYVRTCAKYPALNRFVSGQRSYARFHPEMVMTVKTEMKQDAPETSIKVPFEVTDTLVDIYNKIGVEIEKARTASTSTDAAAALFNKLPRLFLKFAIWLLTLLDYFGKLPKALIAASPFHGSVIITDIGSMGLPGLFHHIYNFGNLSMFITLGAKRKAYELDRHGESVTRHYIDLHMVIDERQNDGFYFSQIYRYFKHLLRNPELLMSPPDEVNTDID